jgi:hypothetical protein
VKQKTHNIYNKTHKMDKETLRMQLLSGVITESEYKEKLKEDTASDIGEKVEATVEDKLEATVNKLSDSQKDQLRAELAKIGVTVDSKIEDVANKLDESLFEGEGDTKQKVANALSTVGGTLMKSLLVPIIPLAIGSTGVGVATGFAITAAVAGGIIGLAKLLGAGESKQAYLNENFVGMGMVGNIFDREKTDYELAFEHFAKGIPLNEEIEEEISRNNEKLHLAFIKAANFLKGGGSDVEAWKMMWDEYPYM